MEAARNSHSSSSSSSTPHVFTAAFTVAPIGLGGTHLGTIPGLRIDGVLVDTTLACTAFKTHQIELSDHRPVSVNVWSPSGENP